MIPAWVGEVVCHQDRFHALDGRFRAQFCLHAMHGRDSNMDEALELMGGGSWLVLLLMIAFTSEYYLYQGGFAVAD